MYEFQLLVSEPSVGTLEFKLSGEVDMATVGPLQDAVKAATSSGDYKSFVFDLCGVAFMDSSGLHVLADAQRQMKLAGGDTKVVCSPGPLTKLFGVMGLDKLFTIVDPAPALPTAVAA